MLGQFIAGLAGPVAISGPPALSAVWFPVNQRTTATGCSAAINMLGLGIASVVGEYHYASSTSQLIAVNCHAVDGPSCKILFVIDNSVFCY